MTWEQVRLADLRAPVKWRRSTGEIVIAHTQYVVWDDEGMAHGLAYSAYRPSVVVAEYWHGFFLDRGSGLSHCDQIRAALLTFESYLNEGRRHHFYDAWSGRNIAGDRIKLATWWLELLALEAEADEKRIQATRA